MSKLNYIQIGRLTKHIQEVVGDLNLNTTSISVSAIEDLPEMEEWEVKLTKLVDEDSLLPSYAELQAYHTEILEFLIDYYTQVEDPYRNDSTHGIGVND